MIRTRKIQVNDLCYVCNAHPETALSILDLCPHAASSWERIHNLHASGEIIHFLSRSSWFFSNNEQGNSYYSQGLFDVMEEHKRAYMEPTQFGIF